MARLSLLIANDSFTDQRLPPLIAPERDARALRDLLRDERIGGFDETDILVNESKPEIERKIESLFSRAGPQDLVCLYFSGHGLRDAQGDLYFAVTNTRQDRLWSTAVSAEALLRLVDRTQAASVVLLLDCCYSGAVVNGRKSAHQDLGEVLAVGQGRCILTASSQIETAQDGQRNRDGSSGHSAFTEVVVEGLRTGKADVDSDGLVTPEDLWKYVSRELRDRVPRQTPTKFGEAAEETHLARVSGGVHGESNPGAQVNLGQLVGRRSQTAQRGYQAEDWPGLGRLIVPIGQVFEDGQRRAAVSLNLEHDHLLVVGRIRCGKSTLLRTLVCGLSLTHTPDEVRFVFLESGGGQLGSLRRLPHYATHMSSGEVESVTGLFDRLDRVVEQRRVLFDRHFAANLGELRRARSGSDESHVDDPHPHVVVFVDRWASFAEVPGFEKRLTDLASSGLDMGVHVVVSARSWAEVSDGLSDLVSRRIEFALADPGTSRLDGEVAAQLARDSTGWAQTERQRVRIALPSLEPLSAGNGEVSGDGATELVRHVLRSNTDSGAVDWRPWAGLDAGAVLEPEGAAELVDEEAVESSPVAESRDTEPPPIVEQRAMDVAPAAKVRPTKSFRRTRPRPTKQSESEAVETGMSTTDEPNEPEPVARTTRANLQTTRSTFNPLVVSPRLEDLLGLPASLSPEDFFLSRGNHRGGPLPLGVNGHGEQIMVNPFGASTPAGLVVGGDQSGKNELVRTLLLGAVARYPATRLNLALLSFRSRNVFARLGRLPHVVTAVEELHDAPAHAERQAKLLDAELDRRQAAAAAGNDLDALPKLLVVLDEFNDLAAAVPAFGAVIKRICRSGFQHGVRLLLSARFVQLEDLAGFGDGLRYRIALRCDATSSRLVIGSTIATELPSSPGAGFYQGDDRAPVRFTGATTFHEHRSGEPLAQRVIRLAVNLESPTERRWPEPLGSVPELAELLKPLRTSQRGLSVDTSRVRDLNVPIGMIESTDRSRIEPLVTDFATDTERPGSLLIAGPPHTFKDQLSVTIVTALALTHTPDELHVYALGPTKDSITRLPHFGGGATNDNPAQLRRMIAELALLVRRRQAIVTGGNGPESEDHPWSRGTGDVDDRQVRVLVLARIADIVRPKNSIHEHKLLRLAADGPRVGVHLIATTEDIPADDQGTEGSPWSQVFRVVDDEGYDGNRIRDGITVTGGCHGVLPGIGEFVTAQTDSLINRITGSWSGSRAPALTEIPDSLSVAELRPPSPSGDLAIPVATDALSRKAATIDFGVAGSLLVTGPDGSGKTSFLIVLLQQLFRSRPWLPHNITVVSGDSALVPRLTTASVAALVTADDDYSAGNLTIHTDGAKAELAMQRLWKRYNGGILAPLRNRRRAGYPEFREFVIVNGYGTDATIDDAVDQLWLRGQESERPGLHFVVVSAEPELELAFPPPGARPNLLRLAEADPQGQGFPPGWATLTEPDGTERSLRLARPA